MMLYQLAMGDPLRVPRVLKNNYMLYVNSFSTTRPILDLKVSLNRVYKHLKFCLSGNPPKETSRTPEPIIIYVKFHAFK